VLDLSAAEVAALTGAGLALRVVSTASMHDQMGMSFGVSSSSV
jgi:hypothetical protein